MTSSLRDTSGEPSIGIDIGGTKSLGVLLVGESVHLHTERPTPTGSRALIETIDEMVRDIEARSAGMYEPSVEPLHLGVGLPGLVTRKGALRAAPNLVDVSEFDARKHLEERLQRRVWFDNDATCATVAEWKSGAGVGCDDLLMVTIGTGIGAGLVANGALVRGTNGFAGELGHMVVDPDGPACPCGRSGCWERYASGSGLALLARRAVVSGCGGDFTRHVGDPEQIRGEHVSDLAAKGSDEAQAVLDDFARWVAIGLTNMVNVLDPRRIVLGGGTARMGDQLLVPVRSWMGRLLYAADHRPMPDVVAAQFGESAGAIGAAMLPGIESLDPPVSDSA